MPRDSTSRRTRSSASACTTTTSANAAGGAGLDEQRDVLHHDGVTGRAGDQLRGAVAHARVHDRVEPGARLRITEHDRRQRGPVESTVRAEHARHRRP